MCKHILSLLLTIGFWSGLAQVQSTNAQFGPPGGGPGGVGFGGQDSSCKKEFTGVVDDRPKGKVVGIRVDSTSGKPVEFAPVALMNVKTNKPIDGRTPDAKGHFALTKLTPGEYRLQYSFIGYRDKDSQSSTVAKGAGLDLGSIKMPADIRTLSEVVVTGQAALIEEKVDRLVLMPTKTVRPKGAIPPTC